jgi:hypothetical protein
LAAIGDSNSQFRAGAKVFFDYLGAVTDHDKNLFNSSVAQTCDDVLENGLSLHEQHWLGALIGEFAHAGAYTSGKNYGFHR